MIAVRVFNLFAPDQPLGHNYAAVIPAFVGANLQGGSVRAHGDGSQSTGTTFVGTLPTVDASPLSCGPTETKA